MSKAVTFRAYCWKLWNDHLHKAKPWARDQIGWPLIVLGFTPILAALWLHRSIDWPLFWTSVVFYIIALILFGLVHFIRAGWLVYQSHEATILQQKHEIDQTASIMQQRAEEYGQRINRDGQTIAGLHEDLRQMKNAWGVTEQTLYEVKTELATERDHINQPDVALVWEWPEEQRMMRALYRDTEKDIIVHNRSNEFVYNVKIETVDLRKCLIFDPISSIGPNIQHKAVARWENNKSSTQTNYYYFFVGAEKEADGKGWKIIKMHNREMNDYFFQIPMAVIYDHAELNGELSLILFMTL